MELLGIIGISAREIDWRKDFTQFDHSDAETLEELLPLFEANANDIVDAVSETSNGIEQVATATDDQAASAEEVASIVSEATGQAEEVRDAMEDVVAANVRQADAVADIQRMVEMMADSQ